MYNYLKSHLIWVIIILIGLLLPLAVSSGFWLNILIMSVFYAILGIGLNVIFGYTGLLSVSQAAFFGVAAYTASLLHMKLHVNIFLAIFLAIMVAGLLGIMLAFPSVRIKGEQLVIVTMGFNIIIYQLLLNLQPITGGPMGLVNIPLLPSLKLGSLSIEFLGKIPWYYLMLIILALVIGFNYKVLAGSRLGLALKAIREDELAAESLGLDTFKLKILSFSVGAFMAGLGGAFYGFYLSYLTPELFTLSQSIQVLLIIIVGGLGNIPAIIVSSVVFTILPELLRLFGNNSSFRFLVYGAILVVVMIFLPNGIGNSLPRLKAIGLNVFKRKRKEPPQEMLG